MGKVLYEASYHLDVFCLIPVFMFIIICFFPKIAVKSYERQGKEINREFLKIFVIIFKIFLIVFICIVIINEIVSYKQVITPYKNGDYKIVEGYVENYSPMPYEGHSEESFSINGIEFSYSDYANAQGYHNAASHGGVITHSGQHLKLGYVTDNFSNENIIVYIEELP